MDAAPAAPPSRPDPPVGVPSVAPGGEPEEREVRLAREITFLDATMMGVGALMGGGVFVLLGLAAGVAGPALLLALFLNGLVTIPTLLVYAELGSASDDAGGGYLWVKQGLGQPFGFLGGWFGWFSHVIACSLYSLAAAAFMLTIAHIAGWLGDEVGWMVQALALGLGALFIGLNYVGVKIGIKTENYVNSVVLVFVVFFVLAGIWSIAQDPEHTSANLTPFFVPGETLHGLSQVFLAMGITFIAFEGYEIISQTSEEIQDPKRNIPRAIWASFLIAWSIILVVAVIALGVTRVPGDFVGEHGTGQSWEYLGYLQERGFITMADQVLPYGTVLVAGAALLLQLTALNATIYSSSRVSFAMGRDGNLPKWFGKVHPKRRTPHYAVLGSGVLVLAMALLPIHAVAASADVMFLLLFLMVNMAYIKLRKTIPQERFGFRAPLFPYIPLIGIATKFFLAVYLYKYEPIAWYVTLAWIVVGLLAYYLYIRKIEASGASRAPAPIAVLPRPVMRAARKDFRVLVLLSSPAPSTGRNLAAAAGAIAKALDGEVTLLQPVVVPEVTPLSEAGSFAKDRGLLNEARAAVPPGIPTHALVRIGHNLDAMVRETVREEGSSLLLMSGQARATVGQATSTLLVYPPCDVAVLRLKTPKVTAGKVLITTDAGLGIRLGTALAKAGDGQATLYHVVEADETAEASGAKSRTLVDLHGVKGAQAKVELGERGEAPSPVKRVLERSRGEELVVVGARMAPRPWRKSVLGPRTQEISDRVAGNVLIVRGKGAAGDPRNDWIGRRMMAIRRYFMPE